ncbi:hypothetical protein NL676_013727 [Syzygium grande]|nr:hypothetical protein NL676_013727 [Syzygium grande]
MAGEATGPRWNSDGSGGAPPVQGFSRPNRERERKGGEGACRLLGVGHGGDWAAVGAAAAWRWGEARRGGRRSRIKASRGEKNKRGKVASRGQQANG